MKFIIFFMLLFSTFTKMSFGQIHPTLFGEISKSEIKLTKYEPDTSAVAIYLFDIGKSTFIWNNENKLEIEFERKLRIKILGEAGVKWANIEIPFYCNDNLKEKVTDIEGITYNIEDSNIIKTYLNSETTYSEQLNENWSLIKFAMPNVKSGSIIDVSYKISSPFLFNLHDWEFQQKIPVIYSEYKVYTIPTYYYTWLLQGATKFDEYSIEKSKEEESQNRAFKTKNVVSKFVMRNLPAFNDEVFITSINDYIIKINFQLSKINGSNGSEIIVIKTWKDLIKNLLKSPDFGDYISSSKSLSKKNIPIDSLIEKTELEKFNIIISSLKQSLSWNEINSNFASNTAKKINELKIGNSADLNLMAVGMLREVGIEAYPLLISTRQHGKIDINHPYAHFFNYVIVAAKIDSNYILSDVTDFNCMNNRIPSRCINKQGLLAKKGKPEWLGLEFLGPSETITKVDYSNPFDSVVNVNISASEYHALNYRNKYGQNSEAIAEKLNSVYNNVIDTSITINPNDDRTKPYEFKFDLISSPELINNKLYVSPFLSEVIQENQLKQKSRKYPIDMVYPDKYTYKSTILFPHGYKIEYVPEDKSINNKLFSLNYSTLVEGDSITVNFSYYFKYNEYPATDYTRIKFYFDEIIKKGNDKIVLVPVDEKPDQL